MKLLAKSTLFWNVYQLLILKIILIINYEPLTAKTDRWIDSWVLKKDHTMSVNSK